MKTITSFRSFLYRGFAASILGLISIFIPGFSLITLIIIIGVAIGLAGLSSLWFRFKNPHENSFINFLHLFGAGLNLVFGIILIVMPERFLEVFIILFGAVIIIAGITKLISSVSFSPLTTNAKIFLGISLLLIIAGTIFLLNIIEKPESQILFFGIIVLIYGISAIIMAFWVKNIMSIKAIERKSDPLTEDIHYEEIKSNSSETSEDKVE